MTLRQSDSAALNIPITMGLGAVLVVCHDNVDPAECRKGPSDAPPAMRHCHTASVRRLRRLARAAAISLSEQPFGLQSP
jgi:hypothetical protein